jgi:alpha-2-macroglobulin
MQRSVTWLLGMLLMLLSVTLTTAQEQDQPPLRVIDSVPLSGETVQLQEPITVFFDRSIDCATAATAVTIVPAVSGETTCSSDGFALTFTPSTGYERATAYTLTISTALRAQDGGALAQAVTVDVNVIGFLGVADILPNADTADVATDAQITVIFTRPVVTLAVAEDAALLPSPLTLSPTVDGTGEWLNTSIYVFKPTQLAGGTQYTVTVNAGLQAVDGTVMAQPFSSTFTTANPSIVDYQPQNMLSDVPLDASVQVTFNQAMNRESVQAAFYFGTSEGVPGVYEWSEDSKGFRFKPSTRLQIGTVYTAGFFPDTARGDNGGAALPAAQWTFATVPLPSVISTDPQDGVRDIPYYGSFSVNFASAMNADTLNERVVIEPKPWRDAEFFYSDYSNSLSVSFPAEPSTEYTITILPGMEDIYGNAITEQRVIRFSTAAYSPDIQLKTTGDLGFYSAYREQTQVYVTHMNVSQLDFQLYSVPLPAFINRVTGDNSYYAPASLASTDATQVNRWSLPVQAPPNVYRYELLTLGQGPRAVECTGALPTRLAVGDVAAVVTDDAVRARASAPDGEIRELMYRDYSLPIIGGPQCSNGVLWWNVTLRDGSGAWVAESVDGEYLIEPRVRAANDAVNVTAGPTDRLAPGLYYLRMNSPNITNEFNVNHLMVVATANLVLKSNNIEALVWATDLQSGAPLANVPITLYNAAGSAIGNSTTDDNGLARVTFATPLGNDARFVAVLQTDTQFGVAMNWWSNGIEPWSFGQADNYYERRYSTYLYTDRPLYRPGQPVYFRGVVRLKNDMQYNAADVTSVPVRIYTDQGEMVYNQVLPLTPFGTFSGEFNIADNASLGFYRLAVELSADANAYYTQEGGAISFGVAEYRLPEFQVNVTPERDEVIQGETINVTVDARYFFGGFVSNAKVEYNVASSRAFFNYQGDGYYSFDDFNYDGDFTDFGSGQGTIASGTLTTDAQGRATITLPASLGDNPVSQTFTIEATVTDESAQAVSGRAQITVHQSAVYVGVAAENYVGLMDEEQRFNLIAVDTQSNALPNQTLNVAVVERRWSSVLEQDPGGRTTYTWSVEEIPVTDGTVTTDANGLATFAFTPDRGGVFKLIAMAQDGDGNQARSSQTMWVSSREYVSWRQENNNRIDLIVSQPDYQIGDTAEILITSPFQGTAEALITVERRGVISAERVTLTSNSYIYQVPITDDFAPNVYVSVMIVKGVDENNKVADFRMGLASFNVNVDRKVLDISITSDREQAQPGETVTYTVRTTNYAGQPVAAEVGVAVTDLASLSIADPNSGTLLNAFYKTQGLGVRTATALTFNTDLLTQTTTDILKGGDGGFGEGGIFDIREEFVDTPYWNATVVTDANGVATFTVQLPDNLTTWRLDARGVTQEGTMLVGQATFDLLSTKPLLIRPVAPRFLVVGDQVVLGAVINNNTTNDLTVEVNLQAQGVTLADGISETQTTTIRAGGRARIDWPALVNDVQGVELVFAVRDQDGQFTDASRPPLGQGDNRLIPVYRYEVPATTGTSGILREADTVVEAITLPRRFDVTQGTVTVQLDASLASVALDNLRVFNTLYDTSVEAVISSFVPNVVTYATLKAQGVDVSALEQALNQNVQIALQRLYAAQKADGGWGWYVRDESDALTTAYALFGLAIARENGFGVDDAVINGAISFISGEVVKVNDSSPTWRLNRQAFLLYALARAGAPNTAAAATLYDLRGRIAIYAQAFLAQTLHLAGDSARVQTLLSDISNVVILSANGVYWEEVGRDYYNWNTDTRTTAIVLGALLQITPDSPLLPNVVRWLMVARSADDWQTRQETVWALLALSRWMSLTGELQPNYTFSAAMNDQSLSSGTASNALLSETVQVQVAELLQDTTNRLTLTRDGGGGVLYYTAYLNAYLPVPDVEAQSRGITVERRYTLLESNTTITEGYVGQTVQARVTIIAPNALHFVRVEDPIPAGADAVDPNLNTSQQIGTQPSFDNTDPLTYGWGWWYFSNIEFQDEKVVLTSTYLPAGTYEFVYTLRLGLQGTYNVIPTTAQEVYFPEVSGRGAGSTFTILTLDGG